jgi:hypothetical protein
MENAWSLHAMIPTKMVQKPMWIAAVHARRATKDKAASSTQTAQATCAPKASAQHQAAAMALLTAEKPMWTAADQHAAAAASTSTALKTLTVNQRPAKMARVWSLFVTTVNSMALNPTSIAAEPIVLAVKVAKCAKKTPIA